MKRLHIVGRKNHGKTGLVVDLVRELKRRGYRVGTIKHTHHHHELDTPGKDSHQHRVAGAEAVGILSKSMNAVFLPVDEESPTDTDVYSQFEAWFSQFDITLVEGDSQVEATKIEVWREAQNQPPMATNDDLIRAIVSDDSVKTHVTVLPREDVSPLTDWIVANIIQSE